MSLPDLGLSNRYLKYGVALLVLGLALIIASAWLNLHNMLPVGSVFLAAGIVVYVVGRIIKAARSQRGA